MGNPPPQTRSVIGPGPLDKIAGHRGVTRSFTHPEPLVTNIHELSTSRSVAELPINENRRPVERNSLDPSRRASSHAAKPASVGEPVELATEFSLRQELPSMAPKRKAKTSKIPSSLAAESSGQRTEPPRDTKSTQQNTFPAQKKAALPVQRPLDIAVGESSDSDRTLRQRKSRTRPTSKRRSSSTQQRSHGKARVDDASPQRRDTDVNVLEPRRRRRKRSSADSARLVAPQLEEPSPVRGRQPPPTAFRPLKVRSRSPGASASRVRVSPARPRELESLTRSRRNSMTGSTQAPATSSSKNNRKGPTSDSRTHSRHSSATIDSQAIFSSTSNREEKRGDNRFLTKSSKSEVKQRSLKLQCPLGSLQKSNGVPLAPLSYRGNMSDDDSTILSTILGTGSVLSTYSQLGGGSLLDD